MDDKDHHVCPVTHRWYSYTIVKQAIINIHAAMKCLVWNTSVVAAVVANTGS